MGPWIIPKWTRGSLERRDGVLFCFVSNESEATYTSTRDLQEIIIRESAEELQQGCMQLSSWTRHSMSCPYLGNSRSAIALLYSLIGTEAITTAMLGRKSRYLDSERMNFSSLLLTGIGHFTRMPKLREEMLTHDYSSPVNPSQPQSQCSVFTG